MKSLNRFAAIVLLLVLPGLIAGCNFPGSQTAQPQITLDVNATLTAIYGAAQTPISPATETAPAPPPPTNTSAAPIELPTETQTPAALAAAAATATSAPSATTAPPTSTAPPPQPTKTRSLAGPDVRPGASLTASYLDTEPTIDGVFDEWNLERVEIGAVVFGGNAVGGENDLSGNVMLGWDEENLYLAVRVKDDRYVQTASGERIFRGDSVELLFDNDVSSDFYRDSLSRDDFQLGLSPGSPDPGDGPEAYLWYPEAEAGGVRQIKIGAMATENGYRLEAKIPWTVLEAAPKRGRHFGLLVSISDNDNPDRAVQQSMVSTSSRRVLTDPTTWGDLTLAGSPTGGSGGRRESSLQADYLSTAPLIDGALGEWSLPKQAINHIVFGDDRWAGAGDLSGEAMLGWDDEYLYLAVRIIDDVYSQNSTGRDIYLGDSLEILFDRDLSGDFSSQALNTDDYQLGLSPGNPGIGDSPLAYLWYPQDKAGRRNTVDIAAAPSSDGGYILEAAIPWSVFGIDPARGQRYGFAISLSDNDRPGRQVQQSMVSSVKGRVLADPTTWGELVLNR